jgi:serine phosphatase RsbU (regulator of sigma subunit)
LGLILCLLGMIILRENFRQRINRITGFMMFFAGMGPIFGAFGLLLASTPASALNLEPFRKVFLIWEFFFPQMLLFSFFFPREIPWIKRHPVAVALLFVPHVVHFLLVLSFSGPDQVRTLINLQALSDRFGLIVQPVVLLLGFFLSLLSLIYEFHANFFALVNLIYIIAAVLLMHWSYRKLDQPRQKKRVGFVIWGIRASMAFYAVAFLLPNLNLIKTSATLGYLMTTAALLTGAGSIAWAIIRYQFMDVRLIIRRGLVFSVASAILVGLYLYVYNVGKQTFADVFPSDLPVLEILFIIAAMLLFQPILSLLERLIENWFMKDRTDYRNVIQELSHDLMITLDRTGLELKIAATLKEAMDIEQTGLLWRRPDGSFGLSDLKDDRYTFAADADWIRVLSDAKKPLGFEELSRLSDPESMLNRLKKLNPYILVPFLTRDGLVGILTIGEKTHRTRFTAEDLTVLSVLANQAAIAVENIRLHSETLEKQRIEEDLKLARDIQKNLLPRSCPRGDRFEFAGYNLPSREVGGDYYDFIPVADGKIGVVIGDISGKGIPAAILMSNLQATFRISAAHAVSPSEAMRIVNNQIVQTTSVEKFATVFYGVFDPSRYAFQYTNAGHNCPVYRHAEGGVTFLREGGLVVGVMEDVKYRSKQVTLIPGDVLVFYTDGVTEARNSDDEEFGEPRLLHAMERPGNGSAQSILDSVLDAVHDFSASDFLHDDLTLVVLKVK